MGELRFCLHRSFKHAPLLHVPLCVSWASLVKDLNLNMLNLSSFKNFTAKGKPCDIYLPWDNLRCHPIWRADHRLSFVTVGRQLCAEAKVRQFDLTVHTQQHVVRLYVSVNDVLTMQKRQSLQAAATNPFNQSWSRLEIFNSSLSRSWWQITSNH